MRKKSLILVALLVLALVVGTVVYAASPSGGLSIPWWTADSGRCLSRGGAYQLASAIGQPDASQSAGGSYTLLGGFLAEGGGNCISRTFLPLTNR